MSQYKNPLRKLAPNEPVFFLPPFKAQEVFLALTETIDWGVDLLNVPNFWKHSKGAGVSVAVLDTGIAYDHPDLVGSILEARDFTDSPGGYSDVNGHGTHVAGIIAARKNSGGIIGVAPECKLLVAKVLNDQGSGTARSIVSGIEWAIERGADIINMSFGSNAHIPSIERAIKKALDKNIFVICAAGNDGYALDTVDFPANYEPVIAVGAVDRKWNITNYSSKGRQVDIVAPGDGITSTYPPNTFAKLNGTSMAAPFVSGVAALVLSKHRQFGGQTPLTTQEELLDHLTKTAIDLGPEGWDPFYGFGLISPDGILKINSSKNKQDSASC